MRRLLNIRINKAEIIISAVITVILAIASYLTYGNDAAYPVLTVLTKFRLLTFMALYITQRS